MEGKIKEAFEFLGSHAGSLTQGQLELLKGLQKYYREHKELSERQMKTLFEIRKYLN
jgi:hypothetical protein